MNLSKEIHDFVQSVVNSRTELLRQHLGNQSDAIKIQHERLKKAFDYAKSIKTTQAGWVAFMRKWEATCRFLIICNKSKTNKEQKLFFIVLEISKLK
jgi:small-conductance mechanosensitive channel